MSEPTSLTRSVVDLGRGVITALPPAFVMLCMVNVVFLWALMRFVESNMVARGQLLDKIITSCLVRS